MKKIMRFPLMLCFLAFVMSMSFMFVPAIESHAADGEVGVFYYGFTEEGGVEKLVLSPEQTDVAKTKVEQTSSTKTVPWVSTNSQIKEIDIVGKIFPYYISFAEMKALTTINQIENLDTSNVTNMSNMFQNCKGIKKLDLSSFDTSNVTNMSGMFNGCQYITSLNLSSFNTGKVENMSKMFSVCQDLTPLDLSNFDTRKVENMSCMFEQCYQLTSLDLLNFDTSKVKDMSGMFNT